jgi:hypothetical protein
MKKLTLLSIFTMFLALSAQAQVEIRPKVGLNFSNVTETPEGYDNKAKLGFQVGVNVLIGERLYVQPGISYFSRSTEFSNDNDVNFDTDQDVSGVRVPVFVGFRFVDPDNDALFNARIFAGPTFTYFTQYEFTNEGLDEQVDWNTTHFGAEVGAGVDISIFFIDASYEFGLTKNYESTGEGVENTTGDFDNIKSNTFFISAGLRFALGG